METYGKFEHLCEILNKEIIYTAIAKYFTIDDLDGFCEYVICENELEEEFE